MDPWTIGGLVGLFNGIFGRSSSAAMQDKQMAFQMAMQRRQFTEAARLQLEIRELTARESKQAREETFKNQEKILLLQSEIAKWPLKVPPQTLCSEVAACWRERRQVPLHILMGPIKAARPGGFDLSAYYSLALKSLAEFLSRYFSMNDELRPVKLLTDAFISSDPGTAEISFIHKFMKGVPLAVILPRLDENEIVMSCAIAGIGSIDHPVFKELFRINTLDVYLQALEKADESWQRMRDSVPPNALMDQLHNQLNEFKTLRNNNPHASAEDYHNWVLQPFLKDDLDSKNKSIRPYVVEAFKTCVGDACKIITTLVSDAYYLVSSSLSPRFPELCGQNLRGNPALMQAVMDVFNLLPEPRQGEANARIPLLHAQLCDAYAKGGFDSQAQQEYDKGVRAVKEIWDSPHEREWLLIEDLSAAVKSLSAQTRFSSASLAPYVSQCRDFSPKEMYAIGKECYAKHTEDECRRALLWFESSARRGYAPALFTTGKIYEMGIGTARDTERAADYLLAALKSDLKEAYPSVPFVLHRLIERSDYSEAISLCTRVLSRSHATPREVHDECIAAGCALIVSQASSVLDASLTGGFLRECGLLDEIRLEHWPAAMGVLEEETGAGNGYAREVYTILLFNLYEPSCISLFAENPSTTPCKALYDSPLRKERNVIFDYLQYNVAQCSELGTPRHHELERLMNMVSSK